MPSNSALYGQYARPVQSVEEVQNGLMRRDQTNMLMQSQALQMQQQQREQVEANALKQAVIASQGDPARMRQALVSGGHAEPLMKFDESQAKVGELAARTGKEKEQGETARLTNRASKMEMLNRMFVGIDPHDDKQVLGAVQAGVEAGVLGKEESIKMLDNLPPAGTKERSAWYLREGQMGLTMQQRAEAEDKKAARAQQAQTEKRNAANEIMVADGNGGFVVNQPLLAAKAHVSRAGASSISVNTGQKGYENESKLRNDFKSEPIYKDYADMTQAHQQIKAGIKSENAIGDVAAATKIMKLLDPGSVVRESELAIAMAAAGKMDRLRNYADMWVTGKKLTPTQRQEFGKLSDELMEAATQGYNKKRGEYEKMGQRYGLDPTVLGDPGKTTTGKLTASEQSELEALRKQFGKR